MFCRVNSQPSPNPKASERPVLVLFPGGPGCSSQTLAPLEHLNSIFDILTIDPPGTAGLIDVTPYEFSSLIHGFQRGLKAYVERGVILAGHSFGGIFAAGLAASMPQYVRGYAGLSCPLTLPSYERCNDVYEQKRTRALDLAEKNFFESPTNDNFRAWLVAMAPIYFTPAFLTDGTKMLASEQVSAALFLEIYSQFMRGDLPDIPEMLASLNCPKLCLAAEEDGMIPPDAIEEDAKMADAKFISVAGAGHFMNFECPEIVARIFENHF